MKRPPTIFKADDLHDLRAAVPDSVDLPLYPGALTHVYIRLDMGDQYERPTTSDDALSYLRAVAKAATIAETIAQACNGMVLEVQGSTIHVGLPEGGSDGGITLFTSAMHTALQSGVAPVYSAVSGWRMTADTGRTLVVPGRGVHGDLSFVSLGNAANRPAKHLYAQLNLPEPSRLLKKHYLGVRDPRTGEWSHTPPSCCKFRLGRVRFARHMQAERAAAASMAEVTPGDIH